MKPDGPEAGQIMFQSAITLESSHDLVIDLRRRTIEVASRNVQLPEREFFTYVLLRASPNSEEGRSRLCRTRRDQSGSGHGVWFPYWTFPVAARTWKPFPADHRARGAEPTHRGGESTHRRAISHKRPYFPSLLYGVFGHLFSMETTPNL